MAIQVQSIEDLTPEVERALVECLRIFARRGRELRENRERGSQESTPEGDAASDSAQPSGARGGPRQKGFDGKWQISTNDSTRY